MQLVNLAALSVTTYRGHMEFIDVIRLMRFMTLSSFYFVQPFLLAKAEFYLPTACLILLAYW